MSEKSKGGERGRAPFVVWQDPIIRLLLVLLLLIFPWEKENLSGRTFHPTVVSFHLSV